MFNTITQTRFGLAPIGDYRIHLSRILSGQTPVLQDGEIGELGNHINYYGKPYIVGAGNFPSLQSLPSNASAGAIAVVANTYPVVKANSGWIVQNLTGTLSQLNSLNIGTLSIGQTAFVTDLGKMAVWNGTSWVDVMGGAL